MNGAALVTDVTANVQHTSARGGRDPDAETGWPLEEWEPAVPIEGFSRTRVVDLFPDLIAERLEMAPPAIEVGHALAHIGG